VARIVLVDDDPLTLEAVTRPLERRGHHVMAFEEGEQALDWMSLERPDLVILDVVMPRLSGFDVCRRMRDAPGLHDLPVVFLTSKNRDADIEAARDAGSDHFVTKPVLAARLVKLVDDLTRAVDRRAAL
jgi:DNA-binding response OmpR family regulator